MASAKSLLSGWRASATGLLLTTFILTIVLCSLLLTSLFKLGNGWASIKGTSQFFSGDCNTASRLNLGLHLLINIMGSIILASSNFFMQVLLAPTRSDVDKAHARSRFAEIGVQSFRNLKVVPAVNIALWLLLAITSVPLHLVFNTCVLEARGSTKNLVVMASKGFTEGAPYMTPGVGRAGYWEATEEQNITLSHIQESLLNSTWEKLSLPECWKRYNDSEAILTNHRHVILVTNNQNDSDTIGWTAGELRYNTTDEKIPSWVLNVRNSLWSFTEFDKTDSAMNSRAGRYSGETLDHELEENYLHLDFNSGALTAQQKEDVGNGYFPRYNGTYHSPYNEDYWTFNAPYCLSEPLITPCRLEVENSLLGVVCLMCILKLFFGFAAVIILRKKTPLATPGDAIESFILVPDPYTKGMCSFSRSDFSDQQKSSLNWHATTEPWQRKRRRYTSAVPRVIWAWTYSLITLGIAASAVFFYEALRTRSVSKSFFGHNPKNANVYIGGFMENTNNAPSTLSIALLANTPQLILSVLYLAYNGIFTRIFAEMEWVGYSQGYKPLRVTQRKGEQVSTYRLQLPLQWSIPLLVVSTLLHWLLSNCFYVIIYETYDAYYPYAISIIKWLQYSTQAILISLLVCIILAVIPIALSFRIVPGEMVTAGSCSAVLSAACHCVSSTTTSLLKTNEACEVSVEDTSGNDLERIATGRVRWGVIAQPTSVSYDSSGGHGHLGFGMISQDITEPEEGKVYQGLGLSKPSISLASTSRY